MKWPPDFLRVPEMEQGIILVTGASRGIGRQIADELRQSAPEYTVVGTVRSPVDAVAGTVFMLLDLIQEHSIQKFLKQFSELYHLKAKDSSVFRFQCLINNAGVYPGGGNPVHDVRSVMAVNFHGPRRLANGLSSFFAKGTRIINISSGLGELGGFTKEAARRLMQPDLTEDELVGMVEEYCNGQSIGWPSNAYNASKGALNALTRIQHRLWHPRGVIAVSICPGWVRTDMGGATAPRSVEKGAETPVWAATSDDLESGRFYRDKKVIPW